MWTHRVPGIPARARRSRTPRSAHGCWQTTASAGFCRNRSRSAARARRIVCGRLRRTSPSRCGARPSAASSALKRPSKHTAKLGVHAGRPLLFTDEGRQAALDAAVEIAAVQVEDAHDRVPTSPSASASGTSVAARPPCACASNACSAASRAADASRARSAASATSIRIRSASPLTSPGSCDSAVTPGSMSSAAPPARAGHHGAAARHRLGDHEAKRFRLRAGVHHHVERAHRGGGVGHVADEPDAAGQALLAGQRLQLVERNLAGAGGVHRAADDIAAHAERLGQQAQGHAGTPRGPSSAQTSPPGPRASRRRRAAAGPASRSRSSAGPKVRVALEVHGVPHAVDADPRPEHVLKVARNAVGVGDHRRARGRPWRAARAPSRCAG